MAALAKIGGDIAYGAPTALVRRNVTRLSAADKSDLVAAILQMKQKPSPFDARLSYYDQFVQWHLTALTCAKDDQANNPYPAHASPGFLPWHRIFLVLFERGVHAVTGKPIALPYWDWTDPGSVDAVFTDDFMGPRSGDLKQNYVITTGPFRKGAWQLKVLSVPSDDPGQPHDLVRAFGIHANALDAALAPGLPTAQELAQAMIVEAYDAQPFDISVAPTRSFRAQLEGWDGWKTLICSTDGVESPIPIDTSFALSLHNRVHRFVAGSFKVGDQAWYGSLKPHTSPNDPVFLLHHAFVDKIWSDWMARHGRQYLPEEPIAPVGTDLVGVPGRSTPLPPFDRVAAAISTPGSVLEHHGLGYAYDTD